MLIHIEIILNRHYAPETVLIRINAPDGLPETNATCFADISSNQINSDNKPLENLEEIYDFVDKTKYVIDDNGKGYYLLETGFSNYQDEFEIRVVCYSPGFKGVSYTIINNTNANCELKDNGRFLVC